MWAVAIALIFVGILATARNYVQETLDYYAGRSDPKAVTLLEMQQGALLYARNHPGFNGQITVAMLQGDTTSSFFGFTGDLPTFFTGNASGSVVSVADAHYVVSYDSTNGFSGKATLDLGQRTEFSYSAGQFVKATNQVASSRAQPADWIAVPTDLALPGAGIPDGAIIIISAI